MNQMDSPFYGRNRIIAALFAIFLGTFGFHKFYLGRVVQGIIYILLCWTGLPTIIGFIEAAILLSMSDESFDRKYN